MFGTAHSLQCLLAQSLWLQVLSQTVQQTCPSLGSSREDLISAPASVRRLVLDFERPSQCSGNVTAWRYCAHRPADNSETLVAFFVVYRKNPSSDGIYKAVSNSLMKISIPSATISGVGHICKTIVLSSEKKFSIEKNDVLGACIPVSTPLIIISNRPYYSSQSKLYWVDTSMYDQCATSTIMDTTVDVLTTNILETPLHLSAQIELSPTQCSVGTNSLPTFPISHVGTFLDAQHPSLCTGTLTAWHYCYYTQFLGSTKTYSVEVGFWNNKSAAGRYNRVENSSDTIALYLDGQLSHQRPIIYCMTKQVTRLVNVAQGDLIGAMFTQDSDKLPILGGEGNGDYLIEESSSGRYPYSLHLYASIEPVSVTGDSNAIGTGNAPSRGGSNKTVVAVSIVIVFFVVIAAISVLVVILWIYFRRNQNANAVKFCSENGYVSKSFRQDLVNSSNTRTLPDTPIRPPPRHVRSTQSGSSTSQATPAAEVLPKSHEYAELTATIYSNEREYDQLLKQNITEDIYRNVALYTLPASDQTSLYAQLKIMGIKNIKRDKIREVGHLGSGQFGSVELGTWDNGSRMVDVALKSLNRGSSQEDTVKFLQEAAFMAQFSHPNVINLHGVISSEEPIVLVVELADGDLKKYLRNLQSSIDEVKVLEVTHRLLRFSQQIAFGMQYLSRKGFIHRDLAARNILVIGNNICKIADFGMSRDVAEQGVYVSSGGKIPLKWTAPETIHFRKCSTASDVWSYGCVLYEIWSLSHKPFEFDTNSQVVAMLSSGIRLPPPPGCPRAIYEIMIKAWHPNPDMRPTFHYIVVDLIYSRGERNILHIPQIDLDSHPNAGHLGAALEDGNLMYDDLQYIYR